MRNLFLIYTQYHLILTLGLISREFIDDINDLILMKEFDINIDIKELDVNINDVIVLKGPSKLNLKDKIGIAGTIKKCMKYFEYDKVFTYNDTQFINQIVIQQCKKKADFKYIYVEDGTAAYNDGKINVDETKENYKKLFFKYIYRLKDNYESLKVLGTSKLIHEVWVCWPELVRDELKTKVIRKIHMDVFNLGLKKLEKQYQNVSVEENSVIVFLENSSCALNKEKYINGIREVIDVCLSNNRTVYVKYHPSEKIFYLEDLINNRKKLHIIIKDISSEILFYFNRDKQINVISTASTSLMNMIKISDRSKGFCIAKIMEFTTVDNIFNVFKQIGINFPENIDELKSQLL